MSTSSTPPYISEDISSSIDAVSEQIDKAIALLKSSQPGVNSRQAALEQCLRATGILSNILTFSHFRRNPHTVLTTCAQALNSACSQMQPLYNLGDKQAPGSTSENEMEAAVVADTFIAQSDIEEYSGHLLSEIVGNSAAKAALLENIVLPLTLTKQQSNHIFQVQFIKHTIVLFKMLI
jgi:hypothetical protein